jgi:hypothetical protein
MELFKNVAIDSAVYAGTKWAIKEVLPENHKLHKPDLEDVAFYAIADGAYIQFINAQVDFSINGLGGYNKDLEKLIGIGLGVTALNLIAPHRHGRVMDNLVSIAASAVTVKIVDAIRMKYA